MKNVFLSLVFLSVTSILLAQPREDKTEYDKKKQDCLVMEYNFSPEAVEKAFVDKMDKLGRRGKEEKGLFNKDKGFRVYRDMMISDISSSKYDYVINVERQSRKNSDESILYFIIMNDGESVLPKLDTKEMGNAKAFLINLLPDIEAANLELKIKDQEDVVSSAEKKQKNLKNDREDLEKKLKKLQEDIKDNEKDQAKQEKELENQKKALDDLKLKRKN